MMNIPMVKVPTFKMTLPFAQQEVKYRPYVVKEEKMLIMANESEDIRAMIDAVGDIVKACTFGVVDHEIAALFDVQYAFLQIRGKSQGEIIEFFGVCGACREKVPAELSVSEFTLKHTPGHTNQIELDGGYNLEMRYPTFEHYYDMYENTTDDMVFDVVADCIAKIVTEEETFVNTGKDKDEFKQFVDNLTPTQFEKLEYFFITMPVLQYTLDFDCGKCGKKNTLIVDGISNFFK